MALRRALWLWAPLAVAGGLAVAVLPPRPLSEAPYGRFSWDAWAWRRERLAEGTALRAVRRLERRVAVASRGDSLLAVARAGRQVVRSADGRISVLYEAPLSVDSARRVLAAAERELALFPWARAAGVPVVLALYADSARHPGELPEWWRRRQFVRSGSLGSACIVELNYLPGRRQTGRRARAAQPLGECALYALLGMPGGVDLRWLGLGAVGGDPEWYSWLASDAVMHARRQGPRAMAPWEWRPEWAALLLARLPAEQTLRFLRSPFAWHWSACLAHGGPVCLRVTRATAISWYGTLPATVTLGYLLTEGDPQRFAALWRSNLSSAEALQAAYGRPAAALLHDALRRSWVPAPHGPQVTSRVVSAALGWIAVALGLALLAAGRRQARS